MCGILLYIEKNKKSKKPPKDFFNIFQSLSNRGPDASIAKTLAPGIHIGHKRLAIIDLSPNSNQPLNIGGGLEIVFNGEIFNYLDLRKEIEADNNIKFQTQSDTEVILQGYKYEGVKFFNRLRGMFAAIIFDNGEIIYFRDTFGIKPLHKYENNDILILSSDEISISQSQFINCNEPEYVDPLFNLFGFLPETFSAFKGITTVSPGCVFSYKNNTNEIKLTSFRLKEIYINHRSYRSSFKKLSNNENFIKIERIITRSTISDVPLTLLLSSGVDSSLIALCLKGNPNMNTITLNPKVFKGSNWDEGILSFNLAKKLNFPHKTINLGTKELKALNKTYLKSIRTLSDDGFNVYVACKKISENGKKVALCGLGGDEIFLGYSFYNRAALINRISLIVGDKITRLLIKFLMKEKGRKVYEFPLPLTKIENIYLAFRIQPNEHYNWDTNRVYLQTLSKELKSNLHGLKKISTLRKLAYLDQIFYMRSQLIKVSDLASMEHSVEMRVPLLDVDILKFSLSLSDSEIRGKKILKRFLNKFLKYDTVKRPKTGFAIPSSNTDTNNYASSLKNTRKNTLIEYRGNYYER